MVSVPRIRVPAAHVEPLRFLAQLSDPAFQRLHDIMLDGRVDRSHFRDAVLETIPELGIDYVDTLFDAFVGIHITRSTHNWAVEEAAHGVSASRELDITPQQRTDLRTRLTALLATPTVHLFAKAIGVATGYDRLFQSAQIFTESRPVFTDDRSSPPIAWLILHNLRVEYIEDDKMRSASIAMDLGDLRSLSNKLDEAMKKHSTIEKVLGVTDVTILQEGDL